MSSLWLVLLLACIGDDEDPCREGTTLASDGHCYPPLVDARDFGDLLDALPACEPAPGPDLIVLGSGCAGDACAQGRYADLVAALGPASCETTPFDDRQVYCTWESAGVDGLFADPNEDEVPVDNATTSRLRLFRPNTAASADGFGVDATLSCFFDGLGTPETLDLVRVGDTLRPREMIWDESGIRAYDITGPGESNVPDGYVDEVFLYTL